MFKTAIKNQHTVVTLSLGLQIETLSYILIYVASEYGIKPAFASKELGIRCRK